MLVRPGERVVDAGLAAVRVADKGDLDHPVAPCGEGLHLLLGQDLTVAERPVVAFLGRGLMLAHYLDHVRIVPVERDLRSHHLILDRIEERRVPDHRHRVALDKAHLENALPEAALPGHLDDDALLACFQFRESHSPHCPVL